MAGGRGGREGGELFWEVAEKTGRLVNRAPRGWNENSRIIGYCWAPWLK